jgi:hypothetical protein
VPSVRTGEASNPVEAAWRGRGNQQKHIYGFHVEYFTIYERKIQFRC